MVTLKVKEVTEQDELKIVRAEPVEGIPLFEDTTPLDFIQHIITNLLKHGRESKEECDRVCKILCKAYMDGCKTQGLPAISLTPFASICLFM